MAAPWPMPSPGGMAFSVKHSSGDFHRLGCGWHPMNVSVKVTGKPNIIIGLACCLMPVRVREPGALVIKWVRRDPR